MSNETGARAVVEGIAGAPELPPLDPGEGLESLPLHQFGGRLDSWCAWRPTHDIGNGERLRARFGNDLLYVRGIGWYAWDGRRWNRNEGEDRAHLAAQRTAAAIRQEAKAVAPDNKERAERLAKHALETGSSGKVAAMQREARPHLSKPIDALDCRHALLTVANGTVELGHEPRLRPHRREDLLTKLAPVAYDAGAECPRFMEFLAKVQPDPAIRSFLQRWFGYCLTGSTGEQVMVIFHGRGANGKSTLLDTVRFVLGDLATVLPFASLLHDERRRGSEASPDIAQLPGARLVTASEPELGRSFSESTIKVLTGEGRITARQLHQEFFEFDPQFKLIVCCNNRPTVKGQDEGIWRRLLLVPFAVTVPPEERDRHLLQKLRAEAAGVLNWMLEGSRLYFDSGLRVPASVRAATDDYREDSDPVGTFLSSWCVRGSGVGSTQARHLYEAYALWCREQAMGPVSHRVFGLRLSDRGLAKAKSGVVCYLDLALTEAAALALEAAGAGKSLDGENAE